MDENKFKFRNHGSYTFFKNKTIDSKDKYSNALPIRRLFVLMLITVGFYGVYWFYKNSEYIEHSNSFFRTIGLFIPGVNLYIYYQYLKRANNLIAPKVNIPVNLIFFFIPIFNFWSIINIQESLNNYWIKTQPALKERESFTSAEKVGLVTIFLIEITYIFLILML